MAEYVTLTYGELLSSEQRYITTGVLCKKTEDKKYPPTKAFPIRQIIGPNLALDSRNCKNC